MVVDYVYNSVRLVAHFHSQLPPLPSLTVQSLDPEVHLGVEVDCVTRTVEGVSPQRTSQTVQLDMVVHYAGHHQMHHRRVHTPHASS